MIKSNKKKPIIDTKLKVLSPTLRQKKRFILIKIESTKKFDFKELSNNLIEEITKYLGIIEMGNSGIWILKDKFDYENQTQIIKVSTKSKDKLIGVLSLIQKINNEKIKIKTIKTSATLKKLRNLN